MIRPNKKCICKKCDSCNFFLPWHMENEKGEKRFQDKCLFFVIADEIPRIKGSIDGLQVGVNEARNRSMEARARIEDLGSALSIACGGKQIA